MQELRKFLGCVAALFLLVAVTAAHAQAQRSNPDSTAAALAALKRGGYVLLMRNAPSDASEVDDLSDLGRLGASGTGRLLAREQILLGDVYADRSSRATETAARIVAQAKPDAAVQTLIIDAGGRAARRLQDLAAAAPAAGSNTMIVLLDAELRGAFGTADVGEGEILVLKPALNSTDPQRYALAARLSLLDLSAYTHARRGDRLAR